MQLFPRILVLLALSQVVMGQNTWMWNQRTHPELEWNTLETDHFYIHFHQGLDSIAYKGAQIAEQCYQPIMDQLELDDFGKTDIVFSSEDEIANGFAMPTNQIFIWVSQNDVSGRFAGSEKWLNLVIPHEFQHVAQFQAHRTWLGIFGAISIPAWWMEGMAEYMTEVWRVGRSDSRLKIHTYRNTMNRLDPHDDGYAKVLYLAWKHGDSSLVKISRHRLYLMEQEKKYPLLYDFETAFEEATGQSLSDFNEEWRRVMNTYYYGYKAQKEMVDEVGEPFSLRKFARVQSARIAPDSSLVAVVGRKNHKMRDYSIYTLATDTTRQVKEMHYGRFSGPPAWSPDSKQLIIPEYHRGSYGSLLNDLRLINIETKKNKWITQDFRALHPVFSTTGAGLFFVAHPGETSQIYYQDIKTDQRVQISDFKGDVQIQSLDLSPDGESLVFMIQEENGDVNISTMSVTGEDFRKITSDPYEDLFPVWAADGKSIVFTSFKNSTPNLYRVTLDSLLVTQMTDVAEGIYSQQRIPGGNKILTSTLPDVDTVRIRAVAIDRVAPKLSLNIREPFKAWRTKTPEIGMPDFDYNLPVEHEMPRPYRAIRSFRPLLRLVIPDELGLFGMAVYNDALGKHLLQGGGMVDWSGQLAGGFVSYMNLQFRPVLNFYIAKNFNFNLRRTWGATRFETLNGAGAAAILPMNSGNSLSSNHLLGLNLRRVDRTVKGLDNGEWFDDPQFLPTRETNVGMTWLWANRRPEADMVSLPGNGFGLLGHAEKAMQQLGGEVDYSKVWVDGFFNFTIPGTPLVLYTRAKWEIHRGEILPQDSIGFMSTAPLYFSPGTVFNMAGQGLIDLPESYNLRGQIKDYPATEVVYQVSELRAPLLDAFPATIMGVRFTGLTTAIFHDVGYIPEQEELLNTMGVELKFNLSIGPVALMVLSAGVGGDIEFWERITTSADKREFDLTQDAYFRLALVNPF
jgi:hypothetical protein